MATKYTDLPAASALDGSEILAIVQGGDSVQTTTQDIADLGGGGGGSGTVESVTGPNVDNTDPDNPVVNDPDWGDIGGSLTDQADLIAELNLKEPLQRQFHREIANYGLILGDESEGVEMNVAIANTVTVPLNATQAFPVGSIIPVVQYGAGLTSIVAADVAITIHTSAGNLDSPGQYAPMFLRKIATDEWYLWNGVSASGGGTVTSVSGTTNRITSTGGATPVIDISATYDAAITSAIDAKVIDSIADSDTTHAPSRNAVFDALALKLNLSGGTMGGNIAMGSNKVTGLAAASGNGEAVRYEQLILKADLAGPTFTGTPAAPTAATTTNTTQLATTAFVQQELTAVGLADFEFTLVYTLRNTFNY